MTRLQQHYQESEDQDNCYSSSTASLSIQEALIRIKKYMF